MNKPTQKQIANGCKHFNGIDSKQCKAGVTYQSFTGDNFLPCHHRANGTFNGACPLFEFETVAVIEAHEKARNEELKKWLNTLAEGKCPDCGANVEPRRQVGRCVYGACGHRLFQGQL